MRQIVLDTETTGLETERGHRIIEVGCVELVNRRPTGERYHRYINPEREIDEGAQAVHGITSEFLADKPVFADIADEFVAFVSGAELIIHNAPFDVGFIDHELRRLDGSDPGLASRCQVLDTLGLARSMHPGQRNSLDALCKRYGVDNSSRELHGALLDARILADVYLAMTGGQARLFRSGGQSRRSASRVEEVRRVDRGDLVLTVVEATADEIAAHEAKLDEIEKSAGGTCAWRH